MFRKKSLEEISLDLEKEGFARDYETLKEHVSDNAYLYYIHFRIGHTNKLLEEIRTLLVIVAMILVALFGCLWRSGII